MSEKLLPSRVLRYDGRVDPDFDDGNVKCLECAQPLNPEQYDAGYCDEICARTAMMKRTAK